jgi:molybdopterin-guanine dinucleotide biosynthesis protein A
MGSLCPFGRGGLVKFQGIVLAGGKSSRFGEDKALARVGGITLIEKAVNLLNSIGLDPVVMTSEVRDYSFLKCRMERDRIPDKGPLGGLYTACCLFERASLVVLTCDMPALIPSAIRTLMDNHQHDREATIYVLHEALKQPFPGIYESALRKKIAKLIEREQLSMQDFLEGISKVKILKVTFDEGILLNVNERKDIHRSM